MLREIVEANQPIFKIDTAYKGYSLFGKEDIQDFIDNPSQYENADNLPKWLTMGVYNTWYKRGYIKQRARVRKIVDGILRDILKGKISQIDFKRDSSNNIFGFQNVDVADYI